MYKAIIAYDGTRYFGWQKTSFGPSIQEEIEKALAQIAKEQVSPEAASRTDRGVHAEGQVIQFSLKQPFEPPRLLRALNAVLPSDIRVKEISFCHFHPTLDALCKIYHYHLTLSPVQIPMKRLYSWHIYSPIDWEKIERASKDLIGKHDFTSFSNEIEKDPLCTIESIIFSNDFFTIRGNRFLYKMVRNLVGTLIDVGKGKIAPDEIKAILMAKDRKKAGITAPAHGLFLHQVFYS